MRDSRIRTARQRGRERDSEEEDEEGKTKIKCQEDAEIYDLPLKRQKRDSLRESNPPFTLPSICTHQNTPNIYDVLLLILKDNIFLNLRKHLFI